MAKIKVLDKEISIVSIERQDYISLTDIARHRNKDAPAEIVKNWMRSRSAIEFLGLWEKLNNPTFKLVEFDQFRNEARDRKEFIDHGQGYRAIRRRPHIALRTNQAHKRCRNGVLVKP